MDLLSMLKLSNIFSPTGQDSQQQFPVGSIGGPQVNQINQQQGPDLNTVIQELLNPKDQQFQDYADLIRTMPKREDYKPSIWRKIAAAGANLGTATPSAYSHGAALGYNANIPEGLKAQESVLNEPYNRAISDWQTQLDPMSKISQMEQTRNVGNRATALGTLQRQTQQEAQDEKERANLEKERQGREKIDIQKERADAYVKSKQFAMDHPEYKPFVDEDGNLILYNPQDPTAEPIETGVKKLSEMEKIDLGVQGELKKIKARGSESRQTEGFKQANRKEMETGRQINRLELKATPSGNSAANKPLTPAAEKTARQNKAIDILSQHPELKPYFVYGGNKQPTGELAVPPKGKETDAGFQIAQRLMGKAADIKLTPDINPQLNIQPSSRELTRPEDPKIKAAKSKVEAGYILITDGKSFGQIKPSDMSKLPAGWAVVK